jgi:hypothetical protein
VTDVPDVEDNEDPLQVYVVPPLAVKIADSPSQIAPLDVTVIVAFGETETVTEVDAVHPPASVPVIEYVIEEVGLAVTVAPLVDDKPVPGLQVYVDPPVAVIVVEVPEQIVLFAAVAVIVGIGLTVTTEVAVLLQPFASVPVTVYVDVDVGFAVTVAPVEADSPVDGDQL